MGRAGPGLDGSVGGRSWPPRRRAGKLGGMHQRRIVFVIFDHFQSLDLAPVHRGARGVPPAEYVDRFRATGEYT